MGVIYRDIEGFPGYRVGDDGSVWSRRLAIRGGRMGNTWRRLKPIPRRGYLRVGLRRDGKICWRAVHHLVLEAFVGLRPKGMEGCHAPDPDRTNNALVNLRWGTPKENTADAVKAGRHHHGEKHKDAKLTDADIPQIRRMVASGMSRRQVARIYGLSNVSVNAIVNRAAWKHVP